MQQIPAPAAPELDFVDFTASRTAVPLALVAELAKLPQREQLKRHLTELFNYERTDVPVREIAAGVDDRLSVAVVGPHTIEELETA